MNLRGIDFGTVLGATGVQGFFGEGYWFHQFLRPIGLRFNRMTFVAKTTTLDAHTGNMPLREYNLTPLELFPKCIIVRPWKGVVLSSVGLSGPGAEELFESNVWQGRKQPFFISFMSVTQSPLTRIKELEQFVTLFKEYLPEFRAPVGLQINFSCPNIGLNLEELVNEVGEALSVASALWIPLVPKFNVMLPIKAAQEISEHHACDALCVSNTIPWGEFPERVGWEELFGSPESPLAHLGGGGLSGKPLLQLLIEWIIKARKAGIQKPINAGGGILSLKDAYAVMDAGASSIFLGSIAILRPWRVRRIVARITRTLL